MVMQSTELERHLFIINTADGKQVTSYFSNATVPRVGEKINLIHLHIPGLFTVVDVIHKPSDIGEESYDDAPSSLVTYITLIVVKE